MKFFFLFVLFFTFSLVFIGQNSYNLNLNIPLFDYPYSFYASKTVSNSTYPNFDVNGIDYLKAYANPSMNQSLNFSASFYNALNVGLESIEINIFNNYLLNDISESIIFYGIFLVAEYIPLGDSWLHEEYHRAILTKNYVNSYNQVNDFPFLAELVSVNNVTDDDLIRFKTTNQSDFVRLHSAGIEGENLLIRELQKKSFFYNQTFPYFSFELLWTANTFYYVWFCHTQGAEITTDEVNYEEGANLKIRDFTGLDFTAWVYDLFKPTEDYLQRGIHPSGVGVDRYIKPSDLTLEESSYLKKQGYLQLLNFVSPFLVGINHIPINIKGKKMEANFAFRHLLTSFGNDISFDLYLKHEKMNVINTLHFYNNGVKSFPGIETNIIDYNINIAKSILKTSIHSMIWLQPEKLMFADEKGKFGGMFELTLKFGRNKFFPYFQLGYKTAGWVAGNEFQSSNLDCKFGLSWYLN